MGQGKETETDPGQDIVATEPNVDVETSDEKLKYPRSVFFIIVNEFCERFSYYGIRTILVLYLRNKLGYNDDTSTVIYHIFSMFAYFFPLFGAMLADSWLGKFRTIFYVSIIYAIGQLVLAASATPPLNLPDRTFALIGLGLIAIGTGGIKPCVSAFGGDQFVMPQQERYLITFFSLFYFAINTGSLISTFLTPVLRADVSCFGENTCYSLAFFVPALLMIASIVIFLLGKPLYTIKAPQGNVVLEVSKCIYHGISNKIKSKKGQEREYWLDHADDKYDAKFISDIRAALQVIKMFLPLPFFWALFDQQGSRWTIQATRMDGQIGSWFLLKPDQMQVVNPLLIIILIPLFEAAIYPCLHKIHLLRKPLQKLTAGGILAGIAFIISAIVELQLEKTYAVVPSAGLAQIRIFNTLNCPITMTVGEESFQLQNLGVWENKYVEASGQATLGYTANFAECSVAGMSDLTGAVSGNINSAEATATSWVITRTGISHSYVDTVDKTTSGDPAIRALVYLNSVVGASASLNFVKNSKTELSLNVTSSFAETELTEIDASEYDIYLDDTLIQSSVNLKLGGVYTVTAYVNDLGSAAANTITITEPNSMHMLWLLPQYIIITVGEIMFSITGLEFAFTQAPISMKSLLTACWLLTVAFGNLIVVIVADLALFDSQAHEFFLFAGLMFADMLIFGIMAIFYKYVEIANDEEESLDKDINLKEKTGVVNASMEDDETK